MPTKKVKTAKNKPTPKSLKHHVTRAYHITPRFVHGMVIGGFIGIVAVMALGPILPVQALTLSSPRDCDTNAVISCGALTSTELQKGYGNQGVKAIYDYFGITSADIKDIDKYVAAGKVYKNGDVMIGNKLVATNAVTAGRHTMAGSTKVTSEGTTFYTRPTSVSFRANALSAFVLMKDGQFASAILAACGNPVMATAQAKPVVTPPKEAPPETPPATPAVSIKTSTQAPESTPTPTVVAAAPAVSLPVTGPGNIGTVVCLAIIGGYIYHVTHRHIRHRRRKHLSA